MQISVADYPAAKAFFVWALRRLMPVDPGLPPEMHPVAVLEGFETRSMAMARKGLAMAIGDIIEDCSDLGRDQIAAIDAALAGEGLPSLSEIRIRFWSRIKRIRERGVVRTEADYYALRNVVEAMPESERQEAWNLLAAYEAKVAGR